MTQNIQIAEIMTRNPVSIQVGSSILEVSKQLTRHRINSLLVLDGKALKGIITAHDIIFKVLSRELDPKTTLVDDVMTSDIVTVSSSATIAETVQVLNDNDVEQIPVMNNDELVGFVTVKDILRIEPTLLELFTESFRSEEQQRRNFVNKGDDFSLDGKE